MDGGIFTHNPMRDVPLLKGSFEGFKKWSIFDIEKYEAHWPIGTKERLIHALLIYTGKRRSYEEIGKMIGATKETVERVNGHHHTDYLKEAAVTLKFLGAFEVCLQPARF